MAKLKVGPKTKLAQSIHLTAAGRLLILSSVFILASYIHSILCDVMLGLTSWLTKPILHGILYGILSLTCPVKPIHSLRHDRLHTCCGARLRRLTPHGITIGNTLRTVLILAASFFVHKIGIIGIHAKWTPWIHVGTYLDYNNYITFINTHI